MDITIITKVIEALKSYEFQDVTYCEETKQFLFHNQTDIMSGYAEITYNSQFEKFNVQIHPIETHHQAELQEVEKHIQSCIRKVEYLNALLTGQKKLTDKIIIM
ncbi:hypothetical protein CON65_04285 [Bacillus pseudomycoides]|uniref:Uncharacterized protein n=1 Tax=Bacillus pseudomycoides TaxID=64104 RepID=A0AA91VEM7_9BACI|nr:MULTISPECIES: hypothetical protein [Bacillus]PEB53341.1 hypothetical protein COO03_09280 [Bacillus sp. AFS098217]PED83790.1 hypothetical protein CON65_04285 [Bacillus pseudomycoides]PEU14740.1 hypothetical protein CN524_08610 [Bacillus sp. AFS019443]PEU19508.1 hypothetical protein CN525_07165 [Bacillus sp. AFS014408]PFW64411.1 hypothetical protein COL20_04550 [Bacillus sp. AFS075034]